MPNITYVSSDGTKSTVDATVGDSVMSTAVKTNVSGIDADCGGACACATCHVYVDAAWLGRLGEISEMERGMLDFANNTTATSRLSCQIAITDALEGLVVTIPATQR